MYSVSDVACGPAGGLGWEVALAGCRRLAAARRREARGQCLGKQGEALTDEDEGSGLPRYLTLALREFSPPLMVFIKAVQIPVPPMEAELVVFFQVLPPSSGLLLWSLIRILARGRRTV